MCEEFNIEHFRVQRLLGEGGFGKVYLALDEELSRLVAIKIPRVVSNDAKRRFLQEARLAAQLDHKGIVTIYQVGEIKDVPFLEEGTPFVAMKYIEGASLAKLIGKSPEKLSYVRIAEIMMRVSEAVHYAHTKGHLIHRDLKPDNIMIDDEGHPYVVDFGLAAHIDISKTRYHELAGTIECLSPEIILGKMLDHRTDIWGLGIILYYTFSATNLNR